MQESNNPYSKALKIIGWIIIIGGIIGSFILGGTTPTIENLLRGSHYNDFNIGIFLTGSISSVFLGVLFLGLGEIIRLLDVANNSLSYAINQNSDVLNDTSKEQKINNDEELPYI